MKSRSLLFLLAIGVVCLGLWLRRQGRDEDRQVSNPQPAGEIEEPRAAGPSPAGGAESRASAEAALDLGEAPEDPQADYVAKRSSELMELAMNDDADSLATILSELTNRDPAVREAAVRAATQFGSRDAIPRLADAATQTDDAHERAEILDAIEFLKMPRVGEVAARRADAAFEASGGETNLSR